MAQTRGGAHGASQGLDRPLGPTGRKPGEVTVPQVERRRELHAAPTKAQTELCPVRPGDGRWEQKLRRSDPKTDPPRDNAEVTRPENRRAARQPLSRHVLDRPSLARLTRGCTDCPLPVAGVAPDAWPYSVSLVPSSTALASVSERNHELLAERHCARKIGQGRCLHTSIWS